MVKIGFIGTGGIGKQHLKNLSTMKDVKILACCDTSNDTLNEVKKTYSCNIYNYHNEMLEMENLDGVYICLPPFAHTGQELDCIRKGVHFFVEKPISLSLEYSLKVAKEAKKKNIITAVGYQRRYWDLAEIAKKVIKNKEIVFVWGYWIGDIPSPFWWKDKKLCGGQIVEQTTHIYDYLRFLIGEVDEVYAISYKGALKKEIKDFTLEDASIATLKFKNGTIGEITSSCIISQGFKEGISIFSKDFYLICEGSKLIIHEQFRTIEEKSKLDPMRAEDEIFIQSLKTSNPALIKCDYDEGLKTLNLTLKVEESLKQGKPVKVGS